MAIAPVKRSKRVEPVTVSKKGWVVIPKEIREKFGIHPGDKIFIFDAGGSIAVMKSQEDPIAYGYGLLKGGPSMAMELVEEHRQEVEKDEREAREWREKHQKK